MPKLNITHTENVLRLIYNAHLICEYKNHTEIYCKRPLKINVEMEPQASLVIQSRSSCIYRRVHRRLVVTNMSFD